ncbi:MAG: hypothetical protein ACRD2J_16575 [Thermoanaerobaculia bacterium]
MSEQALLPRRREGGTLWSAHGLSPRQERIFHRLTALLVLTLGTGWVWSIWTTWIRTDEIARIEADIHGYETEVQPSPIAGRLAEALTARSAASMAFLNEAALRYANPFRGYSGDVRMISGLPGMTLAESTDPGLGFVVGGTARKAEDLVLPPEPGIYDIELALDRVTRDLPDLRVISLVPFSAKRAGKIGAYMLGSWPYEDGGTPRTPAYADPAGFIEVPPEAREIQVSEHFRLGQFLTKGQEDVWPKYLLLEPRLLDKLELMIEELEQEGVDVRHVTVMSGFRTPRYNVAGGRTAGRANLSRHMYGDGADVFLDNDRDFWTDDVNGDGRVNTADAEMMARAAERVERKYPSLVGGIGIYPACCGHGPFVHIDVRGNRARWRGSGTG